MGRRDRVDLRVRMEGRSETSRDMGVRLVEEKGQGAGRRGKMVRESRSLRGPVKE